MGTVYRSQRAGCTILEVYRSQRGTLSFVRTAYRGQKAEYMSPRTM
jgi:hypothetical protein